MTQQHTSASQIPCVIQVGFAGSRRLFDNPPADLDSEQQWRDVVMNHLRESLNELPAKLGVLSPHFLCGISAIASGADAIFTRVCRNSQIPQRLFLPQPIAEFFAAKAADGSPDFTLTERTTAESLVNSPHIIQQRVVSDSLDRTDRFRETNSEILRVSDIVVCLVRHNSNGKPGGTDELLKRSLKIDKPVLEIRVSVSDGQPVCRNEWHIPLNYRPNQLMIPKPLDRLTFGGATIPSSEQYCEPLKNLVSTQAKEKQHFFRYAAALIIAAHFMATICATAAIGLHGHAPIRSGGDNISIPHHQSRDTNIDVATPELSSAQTNEESRKAIDGVHIIPWLLGIELILLTAGFLSHRSLHHSEAARIWANARVVAELARSISAIHPRHVQLDHFFRLSLPPRFRPLLRTLNVLHLRSTQNFPNEAWELQRDKYIRNRVDQQIGYYKNRLVEDSFRQKLCQGLFTGCSVLAIVATSAKLILLIVIEHGGNDVGMWPVLLGTLAIILPVLAVAGLSWSAALDCEARIETFTDTLNFLKRQREILNFVDTPAEFDRMVLETETILLNEVANWFSRRANTGVT